MSFNKIILVGNLGRDPELRYTPQGDAVCSFTIATNERKKDKSGEFQDVTTWFKVTLWRNQAENAAKYLSKGRQVYIEGRLGVEEWTDRDGKERYTLAVTATDMQFIGSRADNAGGGEYSGGANVKTTTAASPEQHPLQAQHPRDRQHRSQHLRLATTTFRSSQNRLR
ncbi:MAG: single-stranded DNA-binding protein [Acidobacteria bacterium]|nr:single-stranded DNA-binding protein [Acidobacteriota bacterium]